MGESKRRGPTDDRVTKAKRRTRLKWLIPLILLLAGAVATGIWYFGSENAEQDNKQAAQDHSKHDHGNDNKKDEVKKPEEATIVKPYWKLVKSPPSTAEPMLLNFRFSDHKTQEVITDYETYHEKKMHVIIISNDFRDFQHLHPDMATDGTFTLQADLKRATSYKIITDARSKSQGWINESAGIIVRDPEVIAQHKDPKTAPPKPKVDAPNLVVNDKEIQMIDGKKISLKTTDLKVGKEAKFEFTFSDAATDQPITDLETYLGSVGHVVLAMPKLQTLNQDGKTIQEWDVAEYTHTHAINDKDRGPKATFSAVFDEPGTYKMWGEFKHKGKTFVVPYVVEVKK